MALNFQAEKQYAKMSQVILRLIEIQPDYENPWFGLGVALSKLGKLGEAVAAYQKQTDVKPDHENAWYNLGIAYWKLGELEQAQQTYAQALEFNPQNIFVLRSDAELALVQNDKARCLQRIVSTLALVDTKNSSTSLYHF